MRDALIMASFSGACRDVIHRISDRADLLRILVGNIDFELFLEREYQLDNRKRVGAEIIDELRLWFDLRDIDVELLRHDLFDLVPDLLHFRPSLVSARGAVGSPSL